jgi:hypothetical protein
MQLMNFKPAVSWSMGMGFVLGAWLAAPGCGDGGGNDDCAPGSIACVCVGELCATGLSCVSGFCVDLGNGSGEGNSAEGNSGDGDPGDGDPTDSGDGDPTPVNLCQGLIDCVSAVQPEALSSYVLLYGPEGECYDIAGLTMEDCWAECDAIRKGLAEAFPDEPACGPPHCGNGELDPDEMCDGEQGCSGTCIYESSELDCSPLTQVGCDFPEDRCAAIVDEWGDGAFICSGGSSFDPVAEFGEACFGLHQCIEPNAVCENRPDCIDDYCCVPTCYLGATDEDFGSCPTGYTCTSLDDLYLPEVGWPAGAEQVGLCW